MPENSCLIEPQARLNQASNKNENMRGGPASHIDQGRHG